MIKRECGDCEICCNIVEVRDDDKKFYKPACVDCPLLKLRGKGCSIFGKPERPDVCSSFECAYLRGFGDEVIDRPDINGVMISISSFNGGTWIFVIELEKHAHMTTGKSLIIDVANKVNFPVIISDFDSKPGKDFGDYVLIRDDLDKRASKIKGKFICDYSDNLKMYKLIIH